MYIREKKKLALVSCEQSLFPFCVMIKFALGEVPKPPFNEQFLRHL